MTFAVPLSGRDAGQNLDPLVNATHRIDAKFPLFHGFDDIAAQHQVSDVGAGNENALLSGQFFEPANVEKSLDLPIDSADRLDIPILIHRAGYGSTLVNRDAGKAGENGIELCRGGAVPIDPFVGLFETEAGREGEGAILGVFGSQVAAQYEDSLVVSLSAQLGFSFNVDDPAAPQESLGRDPGRFAEAEIPHLINGQAVDLSHDASTEIHQQGPLGDHLLNFLLYEI